VSDQLQASVFYPRERIPPTPLYPLDGKDGDSRGGLDAETELKSVAGY
jgi:hypothetical protein